MKIVILHSEIVEGANEDELDVMVQVDTVAHVLAAQGHRVIKLPLTLNIGSVKDRLQSVGPDLVFNLVETVAGSGRLIHFAPALLDHLQVPYTGTRAEGMFLTSNKLLAKKLLEASGIPTPPWFSLQDQHHGVGTLTAMYIIKSVWEHASIGLDEGSIVTTQDPLLLSREIRSREGKLGGSCFAESYVEGREFNLSILASESGPEVLPPAEIRFIDFPEGRMKLVDYRAKWETQSFEYIHTPRCFDFPEKDSLLLQNLKDIALRCWHLFSLRGYARVDFRIDRSGMPWVLEINANPCLSPDAGFYAACQRAGLSMAQVIARMMKDI